MKFSTKSFNIKCHVTSSHTTLDECVPIVKMHRCEHGGEMGGDVEV